MYVPQCQQLCAIHFQRHCKLITDDQNGFKGGNCK